MNDPWWEDAVIYQIYPRSFADSDGDGVGDLRGVIQHLDYLRDLGIGAIWLSPIFQSPMLDFGYDISDHTRIDPLFGTDEDAAELIRETHARGMRIVFDIVLGHTSHLHPWFIESASSRTSPTRDFYVWRDGPTPGRPEGGPPTNWIAGFPPDSSTWTWHEPTEQWYLHSHLPEQPDLDWSNPRVRAAQLDTLRFWLDRGIDGVRLDSINRLGKDPAYRDNVAGQPLRQQDWPTIHDYLREVRRVVDEYPDVLTVGEVWEFEQRRLVPYLAKDELHQAHNFAFARLPFDARAIARTVSEFTRLAGTETWPAWFLNNHDEPRIASRWAAPDDDDATADARARLAAVLLLLLRGTPYLYQGEELGLRDTRLPDGVGTDLNGRDPQRTPMPWLPPSDAGPGAGFTDTTPWLPVDATVERLNVRAELGDDRSMLAHYRRLIQLRSTSHSLRRGALRVLDTPAGVLAFTRESESESWVVVLSFASRQTRVRANVLTAGWSLVASDEGCHLADFPSGPITIAPLGWVVLRVPGQSPLPTSLS